MSITYNGIEWTYDNLNGIGYDSSTLSEPYATWFYLITEALNEETESFSFGDDSDYIPVKCAKELIIKLEEYGKRKVSRLSGESFTITDSYAKNAVRINEEPISLSDESKRQFFKSTKDDIIYTLDECRYIKDDGGVISVVDQKELSGSAELFDFELNDSIWNETSFDEWCEKDCPVNYNDVRPFYPGEYEYTNAYVGFRLKIPDFTGQYGVANSTVYVDVEDTVEKGVAEALGGGLTRVEFSKRFYTSPQIMSSLNYATEGCYIEIPVVTKDYFEFGIKSINTGNYLAGEINWLADGY